MMAAMVELFCGSVERVPDRIVLAIDDTRDPAHGGQQLALFHAYYDERCFLPIPVYEAITGEPVAVILRPGETPDGAEVALVLRHVVGAIRRCWPRVDILVRGDSRYGRPEAMSWCERNRVAYGLVRAQPGRLPLRHRRQPGPARARASRPSPKRRPWSGSMARPRRSAASASSPTPPRRGGSSAG